MTTPSRQGPKIADPAPFVKDQIVKEGFELGIILQAGRLTYDVVWLGGSTSRYRYSQNRPVVPATPGDLAGQDLALEQLQSEAQAARRERREGAHVRRGQVWPSR